MKTKNIYLAILVSSIISILALFYKYNLESSEIEYVSKNINENKVNNVQNGGDGVAAKERVVAKSELSLLFVGDIMTDRYIRKQINKYTKEVESSNLEDKNILGARNFVNKYLNNLKEINSKYDYVVANLEGPITENKSKSLNDDGSYGKGLIFTFPTSTVEILKLLNIKVVSLANNHTDNFYHKGYEDSKKFLTNGDINYFGNPYNFVEELSKKVCKKNICIAYIGYNQFTKNNSKEIVKLEIERIKKENTPDFIVVFPHWGTEYEKLSNQTQKEYSRAWVDAGADLVVGAHPHVVQESEVYKNKHIYYSLGNYIFDQWFEENVKHGLSLDVNFKKECENNTENKEIKQENFCKKEIKINKELKVFIDRNGVRYVL